MQNFQDIEHFVKTLSAAIKKKIPTKVSQLTNDAGYKTTDTNTTYKLSKSGSTVTLTGSDGSTTSVTDSNTTYSSLKNPYSLTIQNNGTTVASYDGSTAKTANFTNATTSANGLMSAADKSKLDGIGAGSNVKSVNGKTGVVNLSKADVGLGNVDNTSDADKAVFESRLRWGGTNIAGDISPIDAAMSNIHSANRAAFANPAGIIVEFSNDGGSTWTDYGASNASKIQLVSGIKTAYFIGKHTTNNTVTVNDKLRITVNASTCGFYTALKKILIEVSTNGAGGAYVELQKSYKSTETSWSPSERYSISGWSGWNSIPCNGAFGGRSNRTGNIANIRLTFGITSKGSSSDVNSLSVLGLQFLGTTYWVYHSEMAKSGHLYSYDDEQNASFPAQITAKQFNGTATNASKVNNHTVNSDVPSGAKFTDTTYGAATQSSPGLMSAADKKKLDGIGAESNVKSVNGKTGAVTLAKSDIGLGNVDNTADSAKSVKYAASAGSANAVAWGNVSGKPSTYPPSSHTHTPAQVGLGNVANLDQSKAIKSITRSGTTFTATALDGTKTTFTQQDTNTTYGVATSSTDGLMSKTDKAKLDGITSGADAVTIKTVKVNGTALTPDSNKAVNVTVPALANNATTTASGMALDARMGKTLSDQIALVKTGAIDQIVNLMAAGWTGDTAPYSQTVNVTGMTDELLCELFSACPKSATVAEREAYNEAFALVASGYAETADGSATFLVDEKPAIDIGVRIKSISKANAVSDQTSEDVTNAVDAMSNTLEERVNALNLSLTNNYYTKTPQNLPSGFNSTDRASMNHLKNGWYWHSSNDGTLNFPSDWGFMIKFGFENDGDFSALYFTQMTGTIYRCSGNANGISGWVAI